MFGLSTIKVAAYAIVAVIVLALFSMASIYHSKWVDAEKELSAKTVALNQALESAKACSEATTLLRKDADDKAEFVRKAQDQAAVLAKNNRAIADRILSLEGGVHEQCPSIRKLHEAYKAAVEAGNKK
jgi:hypothetical protein